MKKIITAFYQDLQTLSYSELQTLGRYLGIKHNGKSSLAREIAKLQSQRYFKANLPEGIDPNMQGFEVDQILEHLGLDTLVDADLSGANLKNAKLWNADLDHANLSNADMTQIDIDTVTLNYAILDHAILSNAVLDTVELEGADLNEANLRDASLTHVNMVEAKLKRADLTNAVLIDVDLSYADLSNAILTGAEFNNTDLTGAIFIGADIRDTDFTNTVMVDVVFYENQLPVLETLGGGGLVFEFQPYQMSLATDHEADTEELLQGLLVEYPTRRAIMDARRLGKITASQFRALLERVGTDIVTTELQTELISEIPQEARDCTNEQDIFTLTRWRSDHLPEVKIRVPQAGKDYVLCLGYNDLITWLRDPAHKYLAWYPNSIRRAQGLDLDPSGTGGLGYAEETFYSVPGEYSMYLAGDLDTIIDMITREKRVRAQLLYPNKRIGNALSRFGISMLHGQAPGYPIYFLIPDTDPDVVADLTGLRAYLRRIHQIKLGRAPLRLQQSNGYSKFGVTHNTSEWDTLSAAEQTEWEKRAESENLANITEKFASLQNVIPLNINN